MYKAVFKIQSDCISEIKQEIFTPFVRCYYIHSIVLIVNGMACEEGVDFEIDGFLIKWEGDFSLEKSYSIVCEIDYFYMKPDEDRALDFVVDSTYADNDKTNTIISKHYIRGQFSLDNGLYNNAVSNFGTALEGILNKKLEKKTLGQLVDKSEPMIFIKNIRDKIHPGRISVDGEITRKEAIQVRDCLEKILMQKR